MEVQCPRCKLRGTPRNPQATHVVCHCGLRFEVAANPARTGPSYTPEGEAPPLMSEQLESLLDQVWRSEADWRLDDRIDLALRIPLRGRAE